MLFWRLLHRRQCRRRSGSGRAGRSTRRARARTHGGGCKQLLCESTSGCRSRGESDHNGSAAAFAWRSSHSCNNTHRNGSPGIIGPLTLSLSKCLWTLAWCLLTPRWSTPGATAATSRPTRSPPALPPLRVACLARRCTGSAARAAGARANSRAGRAARRRSRAPPRAARTRSCPSGGGRRGGRGGTSQPCCFCVRPRSSRRRSISGPCRPGSA